MTFFFQPHWEKQIKEEEDRRKIENFSVCNIFIGSLKNQNNPKGQRRKLTKTGKKKIIKKKKESSVTAYSHSQLWQREQFGSSFPLPSVYPDLLPISHGFVLHLPHTLPKSLQPNRSSAAASHRHRQQLFQPTITSLTHTLCAVDYTKLANKPCRYEEKCSWPANL